MTGASGMLGRHLCRDFARRGWQVRALVRDPAGPADLPPGTPLARCDLPEALDETALQGLDALVHCAWATRATDPESARLVNEEGTRRILAAARRAGVPRFVFVSSLAADAESPSYYGRSKHAMEELMDPARDLIVRPGLVLAREGHGLFQQMRDVMCRAHLMPLFGGGAQPLQTVHVDDVGEAVARALERDLTGAVNVAEPDPVALGAFLRMLARRLRVRCLFLPLPFAPVLAVVRILEALRLPFPLRSESLLGLKALRQVPVSADLHRLDLVVRTSEESLASVS